MVTRAKSGIFKPKVFNVDKPMCKIYTTPLFVFESLIDPRWKQAMVKEYQALIRNNTWELVPAIEIQLVVSNKWVFRVKYKANWRLDKYKARLVEKGFQ